MSIKKRKQCHHTETMPSRKKKITKRKKKSESAKKKNLPRDDGEKPGEKFRPSISDTIKHVRTINSKYLDKGGVKRLLSPFSKFETNRLQNKTTEVTSASPFKKTSLTPKEKNYILCSCQTRSSRYSRLKSLAADAIKENKIFLVHGHCNAIRKALVDRGWVEKIPPNVLDLAKVRNRHFSDSTLMHNALERLLLSNFVEKYHPNFIWNVKDSSDYGFQQWLHNSNVIYNKLKVDGPWTTKQGLCATIKNSHWYYIDDVSEVFTPRTYTSFDEGERMDFEDDYKLTACTSLLKWVLSMIANDRTIFKDSGTIAINVIVFALNRCKEYIFRKQNKDIDKLCVATATAGQWNSFLKKYYTLIAKEDYFITDKENKLPLYLGYAKYLLREILKYRPQLSCEGCLNIWIIKPAHCSRGRGIRMASKLGVLMGLAPKGKYVFQKYIEEPLLVHSTKFDIRQYYLVTNTSPLVIWMYKDCYLKFSSQKYNLRNFHESIHLTNNAVQKKYKNCKGRHPELPENNMWDLQTYKQYLHKIGKDNVWDSVIYPGMRKSIVSVMLSCQETMTCYKNRFELYGCDFILDKDYKPWLIEINSCPDFNPTTDVTARICPDVLADTIKVVIDHAHDPSAPTGMFECIYRQLMCLPRYGTAADLVIRGTALPVDYFYRGKISLGKHIKGQKDADIKIEEIMETINYHDKNLKKESQSESNSKHKSSKTNKGKPKKEESLNLRTSASTTIFTQKLDDLIEKITAENSQSDIFNPKVESSISSSSANLSEKSIAIAKSVTNLNSFTKKSITRFASTELLVSNNKFGFSAVNDGPNSNRCGKNDLNIFKETHGTASPNGRCMNLKNSWNTRSKSKTRYKPETVIKSLNSIVNLTNKLYCFLNKKEEEYKDELKLCSRVTNV